MQRYGLAGIIGGLLLLVAGCPAPRVKVEVLTPSELTIPSVKNVAVGGFQVTEASMRELRAAGGRWSERGWTPITPQALADQVKSELLGGLSRTPHYRVIDTAAFDKLYQQENLLELTGRGSFNPDRADAVIFGRIWVAATRIHGEAFEKKALKRLDLRGNEARTMVTEEAYPVTVDQLSCALVIEFTVLRLQPVLEVITVDTVARNFEGSDVLSVIDQTIEGEIGDAISNLLGGGGRSEPEQPDDGDIPNQKVLSAADQVLSHLARSAVDDFVKRITLTRTEEELPVAQAGDARAYTALLHGAKEYAAKLLREVIENEPPGSQKDAAVGAAHRYNLGLAYELMGPAFYQDSILWYRRAVELMPEVELYAEGLGRVSKRVRSFSRAEYQRILAEDAERTQP